MIEPAKQCVRYRDLSFRASPLTSAAAARAARNTMPSAVRYNVAYGTNFGFVVSTANDDSLGIGRTDAET